MIFYAQNFENVNKIMKNQFQEFGLSCHDGACENGGICFQQPGGFLCECPAQYTGMTCQNVSTYFITDFDL